AAAPRARAHARRGRARGQAGRQDRGGRLRAAALVESAALSVGSRARAARAVRARSVARRDRGVVAGAIQGGEAALVLRRALSAARDHARVVRALVGWAKRAKRACPRVFDSVSAWARPRDEVPGGFAHPTTPI